MRTRIKEVMVDKGVSSAKLAELLGVSKATISNLINNKTMPSIDTLERIADVLDVPFVELFQKDESKPKPNGIICPHCGKFVPLETKVASAQTTQQDDDLENREEN